MAGQCFYYKSRKGFLRIERREEAIARLMPYGKWTCANGREVLFDRDYAPICERWSDGTVAFSDGMEFIENIVEERWFYRDATPSAQARQASETALRSFGIIAPFVKGDIEARLAMTGSLKAQAEAGFRRFRGRRR